MADPARQINAPRLALHIISATITTAMIMPNILFRLNTIGKYGTTVSIVYPALLVDSSPYFIIN